MTKQNPTAATVLAAQKRYEEEVQKLLCNWEKLAEHVRTVNALIDQIPTAADLSRVKAPSS